MNNNSSLSPFPFPICDRSSDHSVALARQGSECNKVQCAQDNRAQRHVCCSFFFSSSCASSSSYRSRSLHAPTVQLFATHIHVYAHPRRRNSYMLADSAVNVCTLASPALVTLDDYWSLRWCDGSHGKPVTSFCEKSITDERVSPDVHYTSHLGWLI